jgi:hypothetical protein
MLSNLFTPDLQNADPVKRLRAIEKMNLADPESQSQLKKIIVEDSDAKVRTAAVHRLTDATVVNDISRTHPDQATRGEASSRLHSLIGIHTDFDEDKIRQLISSDPSLVSEVIKFSPFADLRLQLVDKLKLDQQIKIIGDIDFVDTRAHIANKLSKQEDLELARRLLRGRDKNAEKIVKSKLDELHAQQRIAQKNREEAEAICEKIEHLAEHQWETDVKNKFSVWQQRWQTLELPADEDVAKRFKLASQLVIKKIEHDDTLTESSAGQQQLAKELEDNCLQLSNSTLASIIEEKSVIITRLRDSLAEWTRLNEINQANAKVSEQYLAAERALLSLIDFTNHNDLTVLLETDNQVIDTPPATLKEIRSALGRINWPSKLGTLAILSEIDQKVGAIESLHLESKNSAAKKLDKLHKRINRLHGSNERGDLDVARRELAAVTKAAQQYTGKDKAALDDRLGQAIESVQKMSDWKDFVTGPKYLQLCEAMEALLNSKSHPDKLAQQIKGLQEQWKALGHAAIADQHWDRFKLASDTAYQPCAEFFKQRQSTRAKNLSAREPLVAQLQQLLETTAWEEQPDYRKIESELQQINNAWQRIKEVEPKAGQKQWKRLQKHKTKIYEHLDKVYDANIELKNQLITQTSSMLDQEISEESLNKLKLLQQRWKQVGITRRKQDQHAWNKFKKVSDKVYQKIKGLRDKKRAVENEQIQAYRSVCNAIHALAKSAKELADADHAFQQLQTDHDTLPPLPRELPEKLVKGVSADYRRACDAFTKARTRIIKRGQSQELDSLAQKAALCEKLEFMYCEPETEQTESAKTELRQSIEEIKISNSQINQRFEKRLSSIAKIDQIKAGDARRRLCIDLEILLNQESPSEDSQLRMKIQLEKMKSQGIGHGQALPHKSLRDLQIDWYCLPSTSRKTQQLLSSRFEALISLAKKQ